MGKIAIRSDKFFNNRNKYEMFGDDIIPVDLNAGFVPEKQDKWGMDEENGEDTQNNILERFGFEKPNNDY